MTVLLPPGFKSVLIEPVSLLKHILALRGGLVLPSTGHKVPCTIFRFFASWPGDCQFPFVFKGIFSGLQSVSRNHFRIA